MNIDWIKKHWDLIIVYIVLFIMIGAAARIFLFYNTCEDCIDHGLCTEPLIIDYSKKIDFEPIAPPEEREEITFIEAS